MSVPGSTSALPAMARSSWCCPRPQAAGPLLARAARAGGGQEGLTSSRALRIAEAGRWGDAGEGWAMVAGRTGQGLLMCSPCVGREVSSQQWVRFRAPEPDQGEVPDQEQFFPDFCKLTNKQKSSAASQLCDGDRGRGLSPSTCILREGMDLACFYVWRPECRRGWMDQTLPSHCGHLLAPTVALGTWVMPASVNEASSRSRGELALPWRVFSSGLAEQAALPAGALQPVPEPSLLVA